MKNSPFNHTCYTWVQVMYRLQVTTFLPYYIFGSLQHCIYSKFPYRGFSRYHFLACFLVSPRICFYNLNKASRMSTLLTSMAQKSYINSDFSYLSSLSQVQDAVCNSPRHTCVLQVLLWRVKPVHGGIRQERVRFCSPPPQVTEHTDHADQSYHIPKSEEHSYLCQMMTAKKYLHGKHLLWLETNIFKPLHICCCVFGSI